MPVNEHIEIPESDLDDMMRNIQSSHCVIKHLMTIMRLPSIDCFRLTDPRTGVFNWNSYRKYNQSEIAGASEELESKSNEALIASLAAAIQGILDTFNKWNRDKISTFLRENELFKQYISDIIFLLAELSLRAEIFDTKTQKSIQPWLDFLCFFNAEDYRIKEILEKYESIRAFSEAHQDRFDQAWEDCQAELIQQTKDACGKLKPVLNRLEKRYIELEGYHFLQKYNFYPERYYPKIIELFFKSNLIERLKQVQRQTVNPSGDYAINHYISYLIEEYERMSKIHLRGICQDEKNPNLRSQAADTVAKKIAKIEEEKKKRSIEIFEEEKTDESSKGEESSSEEREEDKAEMKIEKTPEGNASYILETLSGLLTAVKRKAEKHPVAATAITIGFFLVVGAGICVMTGGAGLPPVLLTASAIFLETSLNVGIIGGMAMTYALKAGFFRSQSNEKRNEGNITKFGREPSLPESIFRSIVPVGAAYLF